MLERFSPSGTHVYAHGEETGWEVVWDATLLQRGERAGMRAGASVHGAEGGDGNLHTASVQVSHVQLSFFLVGSELYPRFVKSVKAVSLFC